MKKPKNKKKFQKFDSKWFEEPKFKKVKVKYSYKNKKYKLWCGKTGKGRKKPLLVLHGGPGGSHSNLVSLQALGFEREVIFFDQLGCGHSDKPDNKSLWILDRYVDEVLEVVKHLHLDKYHLIGHSFGAMLATVFASKYSGGLMSLNLASPILNMPLYINGTMLKLRKALSPECIKIIDDFELRNIGSSKKYEEAVGEHIKRHICKLYPNLPKPLTRLKHLYYPQVHDEMIGQNCMSELNILGNLKETDVSPLIEEMKPPILFSCGDHECCPPKDVKTYYKAASNAELHIFKDCRHMTMLESPVEFLNVARNFMVKHEKTK